MVAPGVNRVVLTVHRSLPVLPENQTFSMSVGMSQKCHKRPMCDIETPENTSLDLRFCFRIWATST